MTETTQADWADAIELAYQWSGYWEDDPVVHMDCGRVGFLARAFLFSMAEMGIIAKPTDTASVSERAASGAPDGDTKGRPEGRPL